MKCTSVFPFALLAGLLSGLVACKHSLPSETNLYSTDPGEIAEGQTLFTGNCSSCHNFRQDGIGPALAGITDEAPRDWLRHFIRNPQGMIESGDERSKELFSKFKAYMPPYGHLTDLQIDEILAYIHTQKAAGKPSGGLDTASLADPIPDTIPPAGVTVNMELVAQFPATADKAPLARITFLDTRPGSSDLYVLDLRGKLYRVRNNRPEVYMDMARLMPHFINQPGLGTGFGSFAFHPDFEKNGLLYTTHSEPPASAKADFGYADSIPVTLQWVLTEWKTDKPGSFPFKGQSRELLRADMVTGIHGVQEIAFNPNARPGDPDYGLLYAGSGDGGSAENGYVSLSGSPDRFWGSVIRIDPAGNNSANGRYGIPPDNPFAKSGGLPEVYVYGFRNPHRMTWTHDGRMLVFNIGHQHIEAIYTVKPGQFCGWPIREGGFVINPYGDMDKVYPLPADEPAGMINYPVVQYDHDEGNSICGGYEYLGKTLPALRDKIVFGDIVRGRVFYADASALQPGRPAQIREWEVAFNHKPVTLAELCGNKRVEMRFGRDADGELYIMTKADGKLYRLTRQENLN